MQTQFTASRWTLEHELGCGTFCQVFSVTDKATGGTAAMKVPLSAQAAAQLRKEAQTLLKLSDCVHVPKLLEHSDRFLVMEKVGKNLFELKKHAGKLTSKTVLTIAIECITALEEIHEKGFLHMDVKPDNFAIGLSGRSSHIYILDFGLSKKYQKSTGKHIQYRENCGFKGSPFFCSLRTLLGGRASRRDDMEALGNVLLYLRTGDLPWFGEFATEEEAIRATISLREKTLIRSLCRKAEEEFVRYFEHCRSLRFEEKPDYEGMRSIFRKAAESQGIHLDGALETSPCDFPPKTQSRSHRSSISSSRIRAIKVFHLPETTPGALISSLQAKAQAEDSARTADLETSTPLLPVEKIPALLWPREKLIDWRSESLKNAV